MPWVKQSVSFVRIKRVKCSSHLQEYWDPFVYTGHLMLETSIKVRALQNQSLLELNENIWVTQFYSLYNIGQLPSLFYTWGNQSGQTCINKLVYTSLLYQQNYFITYRINLQSFVIVQWSTRYPYESNTFLCISFIRQTILCYMFLVTWAQTTLRKPIRKSF